MKNNILERAIKTFAFAFLGVFIPEICVLLTSGAATFDSVVVVSIICASLAAGLSATWNFIENVWDSKHHITDIEYEPNDNWLDAQDIE